MKIIGLSGALTSASTTRALVQAYLQATADHAQVSTGLVDLADIATELGAAKDLRQLADNAAEAYHQVLEADALIIAAPVSRTSYPGLFKHFFDLLDQTALRGKTAIIAATGPTLYSAILDQQLRPLLDYFGLYTLPIDTYLSEPEFAVLPFNQGYCIQNDEALVRIRFATQQLISLTKAKSGQAA
ncbi:NADPH-dependent FMN reductase [Chromatiaceae bacterium AAb-1]|nr:NADPH-dependent FMN reductase [Chromatiaceae bacterium AAb-1]